MILDARPFDPTCSLFHALEAIGETSPNEPAIIGGDSRLTLSDFIARSSAVGALLQDVGVCSGDRVALMLPNSIEFAVSAFAVWKQGAILVPLHIRLTEEEIVRYISDCGVRAVITSQRMSSTVELIQEKVATANHAWLWQPDGSPLQYVPARNGPLPTETSDCPKADPSADRPAVTMFSTGSTGLPKRVTRSHRQVLEEVESVSRVMELGAGDRILGVAPLFHSYGLVNALLCGLMSGARVYLAEDFFPKDIAAFIEREAITGFPGVPFMFQLLAEVREAADFRSLRYAVTAGAPLSKSTAESFESKYGIAIRQLYGTTETGVVTIENASSGPVVESSVGVPIPGVEVQILNDTAQPVLAGEQGNVAIKSCFAASGYDHPVDAESTFRGEFFFPGDLGRIGANGRLILCGRKRGFINVAGNKVDPTEVEAVLKQLPAVSEAVVLGVPDAAGLEKVKAVIVATTSCTRNDIFAHCSKRLADYKRPRAIEFRKELPRSPVGKILRKYLIDNHHQTRSDYVFDPCLGFGQTDKAFSDDGPLCSDSPQFSLATLSPVLRSLLVTDGTITKILEAFFWEPIDVELLLHEDAKGVDYPGMGMHADDPLSRRRVILRGRFTSSAYVFAETIIASSALSPILSRMLVENRKGIGEIIREGRLETYRELITVERTRAGQWSGYLGVESSARVALRRYRIHHNGRAAIHITEVFPEDRF